jgi:hypothetical protein
LKSSILLSRRQNRCRQSCGQLVPAENLRQNRENWRHRGLRQPVLGISRIVAIASTVCAFPVLLQLVMATDMVKPPGVTMFPAKTQNNDSQRLIRT